MGGQSRFSATVGRMTTQRDLKALLSEMDADGIPQGHGVRHCILKGDHYAVVRDTDGKIAGAITWDYRNLAEKTMVITALEAVNQKNGAGTALMKAAFREALTKKMKEVIIHNPLRSALGFYLRLGGRPQFGAVTESRKDGDYRIDRPDAPISIETLRNPTTLIKWTPAWDENAMKALVDE